MKLIFTFRTISFSWYYAINQIGKFQYAMGDKIMWMPGHALKKEEYESKHRPKRIE